MKFSFIFLAVFLPTQFSSAQKKPADNLAIPVTNDRVRMALGSTVLNFKNIINLIPGTQSEQLDWLSSANPKRDVFLQATRAEAQKHFSQNSELPKLEKYLLGLLESANDKEFEVGISDTRSIVVKNEQFKRTMLDVDQGQITEIFSTDLWAPHKAAFVDVYPSTQKRFIAALVNIDGSIDNSQLLVYDVANKKIVLNTEVGAFLEKAQWISDEEIVYYHPQSNSHGTALIIYNVKSQQKKSFVNYGPVNFESWVGYSDFASGDVFLKDTTTDKELTFKALHSNDIMAEDKEYFYIKGTTSSDSYAGKIFRLRKSNFAELEQFVDRKANYNLDSVYCPDDNTIAVVYTKDSQATIDAFSKDGKLLGETILPDILSVSKISAGETQGSLKLTLNSPFGSDKISWAIQDKTMAFGDLLTKANRSPDFEIVTKIEYFQSVDGEYIPARISYKKDTLINGNNPVFMEAYGGFNLAGYLAPKFGKAKLEFMRRGGVLVGTGVRGGSERGYEWYKAGSGATEMNTSNDVIAIADGLVVKGYTQPNKVVLTGTSNGGYVVANAAMMSPQSFGLVIPVNGVQDQLAFPLMDRWGIGWQDEFTNPFLPKDLKKIFPRAPLENIAAAVHKPNILIVNGEQDTRVNKVHSYKLKAHLDDVWPGQAILLSVDNAGHWANSNYLLDDIGAKANAKIWAEIYAQVGMQF